MLARSGLADAIECGALADAARLGNVTKKLTVVENHLAQDNISLRNIEACHISWG